MIDFPSSPTNGQVFISGGVSWTWDGAKWTSTAGVGKVGNKTTISDTPPTAPQVGDFWLDSGTSGVQLYVWYDDGNSQQWVAASNLGGNFLPLTGGTMTGPLILASGNPAADSANIRYRNRVINGDMAVDQRNNGAAIGTTVGAYAIDRWKLNGVGGGLGKGNVGQNLNPTVDPPPLQLGWQYYLGYATTAAYTPVAADALWFNQWIEGYNFNDANWGTAAALPVVLEFWAFSTLTGTFAGSLRNLGGARSYVFTFSLPNANTWTKIRINIPGDTTGTWQQAGNAAALNLTFNIGSGSNYQATPNAWAAGNFALAPGAVNVVGTLNAVLHFTGVALMVGAGAANAEPQFKSYADNLIDCMRYFQKYDFLLITEGYSPGAGGGVHTTFGYPVCLRTAAIPTFSNIGYSNASALTAAGYGTYGWRSLLTITAVGFGYANYNAQVDADF
jgi:hypothetical protein